MIIKYYELEKKINPKNKFFLLYGNNSGLIKETIEINLKPILFKEIFNYEENEVVNNLDNFKENIMNKSFFENEKLIIITRTSDKILKIITEIIEKRIKDVSIILTSGILDKKSKLRNFFEKSEHAVCIPFYEDNHQSLVLLVQKFLKEKKILLSNQNINLIVERCRGDRINLYNELQKIESFSANKDQIKINDILKLTNLTENFGFNELVDNTLAKNQKRTLYILNENNFASEDSILIIRIFINKLKRLLKIQSQIKNKNNIEDAIKDFKPPIFWKEKDILKKQIKIWGFEKIEKLIVKANYLELIIKKYPSISTKIVTDFILENTNEANN